MAHFSIQILSLCPDYIITACIWVSSSFSFFENILMSSMYIRWLIFSCDLLSLYPAVHFLSMWLSGIIATINCNGDSASPWNIPVWIFASAKLLVLAVNSTFQVFMVFSMKFITSSDICTFCGSLLSSFAGLYHMPFCSQSRPELDFSVWSYSCWGCVDLCRVTLLCLWIICSNLSFPQGTIHGLLVSSECNGKLKQANNPKYIISKSK